jgi:hypothetical protein
MSRPALGPTQPPVQWVPGLSQGIESGQGVVLTTLLLPRSQQSTAIPVPPSELLGMLRGTFSNKTTCCHQCHGSSLWANSAFCTGHFS